MPYRREKSACWWVSYVDPRGTRVRRSTETTDKKEAEALEAKWKLEVYRSRQWDEPLPRSFDELMVAYLTATADEKRSSDKDRGRTKNLRRHFGGRELNQLAVSDIRAYVTMRKEEGISNSTINRELALFSVAINYANREWDWRIFNIAAGRKLKEPAGRVRWITREEARVLLDKARAIKKSPHLSDFILLALHTGCRSQEMLGLEWKRVDLQANLIFLEADQTKTGKRRSVPLNHNARAALLNRAQYRARHCPDCRWVFSNKIGERIQSVRKGFAAACKEAEITDFRIHDMRHTCAAWLVSSGAALAEVRDLLGHASITMTERYAHLEPENVRNAVSLLDGPKSHSGHTGNTM